MRGDVSICADAHLFSMKMFSILLFTCSRHFYYSLRATAVAPDMTAAWEGGRWASGGKADVPNHGKCNKFTMNHQHNTSPDPVPHTETPGGSGHHTDE